VLSQGSDEFAQVTCLQDGTIIDCYSGTDGSPHDLTPLRRSGVLDRLGPGECALADGAYQGVPHVTAPYRRSDDPDREIFNVELRRVRVKVEHSIAAVKNKFAVARVRSRHSDHLLISRAFLVACQLTNYCRRVRA
jgi:hypothetical protein